MKAAPRRSGRAPQPGSRFLADVVAKNVQVLRADRAYSQGDLASRMKSMQFEWSHATVSDVERRNRNVTIDELFALALALGVTVPDLTDPTGVHGRDGEKVDIGRGAPLGGRTVGHVWQGRVALGLAGDQSNPAVVFEEGYVVRPVPGHEQEAEEAEEDIHSMWIERATQQQAAATKRSTKARKP